MNSNTFARTLVLTLLVFVAAQLGYSPAAGAAEPVNIAQASVNLARSAKTRQSTTHEPARFSAAMAVDGDLTSFTHTQQLAHSWLEIDLGSVKPIGHMVVHNRRDCCGQRLNAAQVVVSSAPCDASPQALFSAPLGPVAQPTLRIEPPVGLSARYICIRNPAAEPLSIAEIEVYAGIYAGKARQSSVVFGASADRAIDGNIDGRFARGSVTHTAGNDSGPTDSAPWIEVDLGKPVPVGAVTIYNRTDCCGDRINNSVLELSLDPCDSGLRRLVRADGVFVQGNKPVERVEYVEAPAARFVCLRKSGYSTLSVAEIVVHTGVPLVNVAPLGTARHAGPAEPLRGPEFALDGRTTLTSYMGMIAETSSSQSPVWWELDFGAPRTIDTVAVWWPTNGQPLNVGQTTLQISHDPCDQPQQRVVHQVAFTNTDPLGFGVLRRREYRLPAATNARFVCLTNRQMSSIQKARLQLAEVQVFAPASDGEWSAVSADAKASSAAALAPAAPAPVITAGGAGAASGATPFSLQVDYGPVKLPACTLTPLSAGQFSVSCGKMTLPMSGKVAGPSAYDLVSDSEFAWADLAAIAPFPSALAPALAAVRPALGVGQVRLGLSSERGFFVTGVVDLKSLGGSNPLSSALGKANGFLAAYVPGYQSKPAFALVPAYVNGALTLALRLEVISACVGPAELPGIGLGLKFNKGALVFSVSVGPSGASVSGGLEGAAFVRPTQKDPWLLYRPAIDLGGALDSTSLTLKGVVSGACPEACALDCTCSAVECKQDWHPLGISELSLRNGYLELGVSTAAQAVPIPLLSLAFDEAKAAGITGKVAMVFDYPAKTFALRFAANKAPALAILGLVADVSGIPLGDLSIDNPLISIASAPTKVFGSPIPAGVRVKGALSLASVGVQGSIDSTLTPAGSPDLVALVNSKGSSLPSLLGHPTGKFRLQLDSSKLYDLVLDAPVLRYARPMLSQGFWISLVEVAVAVGDGAKGQTASAGGIVQFRILGAANSLNVSASVALDPAALAKELSAKTSGLIGPGGVLAVAFGKAAAELDAAAQAAAATLASGGRVVYNGVATVGTVVGKTAAQAGKAGVKGVEKAFDSFKGAVGL